MIINSSSVAMNSSRQYASHTQTNSLTVNTSAEAAASLTLSPDAKNYVESLKEKISSQQDNLLKKQQKNQENNLKNMLKEMNSHKANSSSLADAFEKEDPKITMLKQILEALRNSKGKRTIKIDSRQIKAQMNSFRQSFNITASGNNLFDAINLTSQELPSIGSIWTKTTASDTYYCEAECTNFEAKGYASTADGRQIDFNISMSMSRSFIAQYSSFTQANYLVTDPLMINVGSDVTEISDQKFLFDLDCDGKEENISFGINGSGFLALDKNGDGKINNGSELFGTKSGDGFADLSQYDSDGNGWIDEADDIFSKLKVWTKNSDGSNSLISIKDFGVGAIYLANSDTEFSLTDENNKTNGIIRKTGFYLKETGGAGTIQHIDLAM